MKIEKVTYQKTYSIGPYLTDRVGFEASIDEEKETHEEVLSWLKAMADDWHKDAYPHLHQENKGEVFSPKEGVRSAVSGAWIIEPKIIDLQTEKLEIDIDNATSLSDLAEIKEACGKAGLVGPYMAKMNQLMTEV